MKEWESVGLPKHWLNLLLELNLVSEEDDDRSSAGACKDTTVPQSKTCSDENCETSPCLATDDLNDTQLATEHADITSSVVNEGIASDSCAQAAISTSDGAPSTPVSSLTAGVLVVASKSVPKYSLVHYKTNVAENFNAVHQWWKMITFWAPQTCHPDKDAVATSIASLNGSEARINTAAETLTNFLTKGNFPTNGIGMTRLLPGAASGDDFAGQHWVPSSLRTAGEFPEGLHTFGAPVLVGHRPHAFSVSMSEIPAFSMSKFILGVSGTLVAFVWPMRVATAMLVRARDSFSWLSSLTQKQFEEFTKNHLSHFLIQPGTVAWIPPAHNELYVALDSQCTILVLPYYSTVMIGELDRHCSDIVKEEGKAYA